MKRFLDPLVVMPLADGVQWALQTRFRFYSYVLARWIEVPARFVVDFASIPRALWNLLPPWQRYGAASVIHDHLYWEQDCTREQADDVLREAMEVLGVPDFEIGVIYNGVRLGGQVAWEQNQARKASGATRMASTEANPPYASVA